MGYAMKVPLGWYERRGVLEREETRLNETAQVREDLTGMACLRARIDIIGRDCFKIMTGRAAYASCKPASLAKSME